MTLATSTKTIIVIIFRITIVIKNLYSLQTAYMNNISERRADDQWDDWAKRLKFVFRWKMCGWHQGCH